jgi:hypothetical protein
MSQQKGLDVLIQLDTENLLVAHEKHLKHKAVALVYVVTLEAVESHMHLRLLRVQGKSLLLRSSFFW